MTDIITRAYQGHTITYQTDGWFNATQAAAKWEKAPAEWMRLPSTIEYINAVVKHNPSMGKTHRSKSGPAATGGGTWLHPKLAVPFSRWLDVAPVSIRWHAPHNRSRRNDSTTRSTKAG